MSRLVASLFNFFQPIFWQMFVYDCLMMPAAWASPGDVLVTVWLLHGNTSSPVNRNFSMLALCHIRQQWELFFDWSMKHSYLQHWPITVSDLRGERYVYWGCGPGLLPQKLTFAKYSKPGHVGSVQHSTYVTHTAFTDHNTDNWTLNLVWSKLSKF